MEKHWTVTIQVHEVTPPEPIRDGNGYTVKVLAGPGKQNVVMTERRADESLHVIVRADTELEAYHKAAAMLEVNRPEPLFRNPPEPEKEHLHRASCDDSGGNLICGFPPGRSIAS